MAKEASHDHHPAHSHHTKAAEHHEQAMKHHKEAAGHYAAGHKRSRLITRIPLMPIRFLQLIMRTKLQRPTFRMPKGRVRSRIQKEASPRHCCAERSNPEEPEAVLGRHGTFRASR